jgi:cobalt/nickel transport system permease protein
VAKLFTLGTLGMLMLASGPVTPTLAALQSWRLPPVLISIALLTHRYLEVMSSELQRLRLALRLRAYRNRSGWHGWKTAGQVAGTLIVRGSDRADRVAAALRCRGFTGRMPTLPLRPATPTDVALAGGAAAIGAGLLLADWWCG